MTVRPLRFPLPHYLPMRLLLVLCAVAVTASGATAQSSEDVIYFIEVAVTVTGRAQNEQSIHDLLEPVFQKDLQTTSDPSVVATEINVKPTKNPNPNSGKIKRAARATSENATGLFSHFEVNCVNKTSIKDTVCYVSLELKESVSPCCILQAICSSTTTIIQVVGKNAMRTGSPQCGNQDAGVVCNYTGPTSPKCDDSPTAYEIQPRNLTCPAENKCNCSTYCSKADAYYTFNITTETPLIIESSLPALLSTECPSCPPGITSNYKDASVACDRATCTVVAVFTKEVSICSLSTLIQTLLESRNMSMNGLLTRVAICGKPVTEESAALLLQSSYKLVDVNFTAEEFCTATEGSQIHTCQPEERVIAILNEKCFLTTTTVTPNTTFALPNTTVSVNETMNTTATAATNATSTANPPTDDNLAAANALLDMTKDASKLNSSQIDKLVSDLERLLSGPNISVALGDTSVNIVSNLQNASLEAVEPSKNRIIGIVDTVGEKLIVGEKPESILSDAVALSVKKADGTKFEEVNFSITNPSNIQIRGPRATRALKEDSTVPQGSVRLPRTLTENLPTETRQMVSRVQFNFYQKSTLFQDRDLRDRILNSGIIGSSVGNLSLSNLPDSVVITLRHTQPTPVNYTATCVFWDFTSNDGSGGWNSRGCSVQSSTDTETICGCNHLTSFGILLDPSRDTITSRVHATILTFITYIGCGVSAIFLAVTLLTYLAFGKLRKDIPSKILIQLCLALLLLNLVFLVDAWLALFPDAVGLCISTAWFLHYFLLVTFTWMGLEAVHMYIALVKVFNSYISRYMVKFSLAGWGIPMIVVIIVIAIDKDNYGLVSYGKFSDGTSDDFCWIKNDVAFYVAVVAYFCVIFLFNVIMFIVVLVQLCRLKRQNPQNLQHRTTFQDVRSVVGITILLGLSWGFAFFAWGPLNLPFMYLFAIFNSLHGFFIFVFHCAIKENVRRQWRTYLCCGRMRLAENSEWSRTATQKTAKKSSMITSLQSSKSNNSSSSSSYLVSDSSDQMNSYGGPFPDRISTADEDPRMDVVLNEINSQYRRL
uniref:Adhesion G-protein coupled receptor G2 n=1 Tax=Knipowitschia caucasica TaxID=637954 RepID=A0AAV2J9N6_KNICA